MNAAPHTELAVADASRLVERLGADTHPMQQYRELSTNAIEAVAQRDGDQTIVWDVDWRHLSDTDGQQRKLSIADTGIGMTAEQMRDLINHLAASGGYKGRGDRGNFGVGAKIAAGVRNPTGLEYRSWPLEGTPSVVRFGRSRDGRWGLLPLPLPDGTTDWTVELDDTDMPDSIRQAGCGTQVTLMGEKPQQDTTRAPRGADGRDWWLLRYLNTRYFELPRHATILVRPVCRAATPTDGRIPKLERVNGMRALLELHATHAGSTHLPGGPDAPAATAHWWILNEDSGERRRHAHKWQASGHMAALMDGEAYETLPSTRGGYQRLQEFGVRFAYDRVVIYLEPDREDRRVVANTSRTRLLFDGDDLPWGTWARAFRRALPDALRELQENAASRHGSEDRREAIARRMSVHAGVYRLPAYRPPATQRAPRAEPSTPRESSSEPRRASQRATGSARLKRTEVHTVTDARAPVRAAEPWEALPQCRWVSVDDGTRAAGDLEDRAARYDAEDHALLINADYRPIQALISHFETTFADVPGARPVIEAVVREWCETALCEAVIAHQALSGSPAWSNEDLGRLVDEIGLSAALAPVVALTHHAARTLAQRLGKRQP